MTLKELIVELNRQQDAGGNILTPTGIVGDELFICSDGQDEWVAWKADVEAAAADLAPDMDVYPCLCAAIPLTFGVISSATDRGLAEAILRHHEEIGNPALVARAALALAEDEDEDFLASGDSRETSTEIMQAIWKIAGGDADEAVRIWEDPTEEEILAIWERVTGNGLRLESDYCWGSAGTDWGPDAMARAEETAIEYNDFRAWALAHGAEFPTDADSFALWVVDYLDARGLEGAEKADAFDALYAEGGDPAAVPFAIIGGELRNLSP